MVPEDRGRQGLISPFSIKANLSLPLLRLSRAMTFAAEDRLADEFIGKLHIRPALSAMLVQNLSGGNQQKVVIGKWLATRPKVLILDEPTQGVDVGAKAEIHRLMDALVGEGLGILMISSELLEVLGMADRILVLRRGKIAGEFKRGTGQEELMRAATGAAGTSMPRRPGVEAVRGGAHGR
jgi:ABC-type sugar transport system ATPase subunit